MAVQVGILQFSVTFSLVKHSATLLQHALKRTQDAAVDRLTVAATEGDLESVKNLLARGLPINKVWHFDLFLRSYGCTLEHCPIPEATVQETFPSDAYCVQMQVVPCIRRS